VRRRSATPCGSTKPPGCRRSSTADRSPTPCTR
jgi:hypothetical protein